VCFQWYKVFGKCTVNVPQSINDGLDHKACGLKMAERWRRISVRGELVQLIEEIIKERPELGYASISDFITDAVRRRVEEISGPRETHTLDKAIKVLAEQEVRRQAMEMALKKCFEFEGGEFWSCIASFMKKEIEKPSTEA